LDLEVAAHGEVTELLRSPHHGHVEAGQVPAPVAPHPHRSAHRLRHRPDTTEAVRTAPEPAGPGRVEQVPRERTSVRLPCRAVRTSRQASLDRRRTPPVQVKSVTLY